MDLRLEVEAFHAGHRVRHVTTGTVLYETTNRKEADAVALALRRMSMNSTEAPVIAYLKGELG